MSVKLALVGLVMALLAACGLYVMKDRVSQLEGELARQQGLLAVEHSQLYRLRAEWATLERPRRDELDLAGRQLRAQLPSGAEIDLRLKPRQLSLPVLSLVKDAPREP